MGRSRVVATLTPYHCKLLKGASEVTGKTQSQIVAEAVKQKFDSMPQNERERFLNRG